MVSGCPPPETHPVISVQFNIQSLAVSGVKVNRLDMYGEVSESVKVSKIVFAD